MFAVLHQALVADFEDHAPHMTSLHGLGEELTIEGRHQPGADVIAGQVDTAGGFTSYMYVTWFLCHDKEYLLNSMRKRYISPLKTSPKYTQAGIYGKCVFNGLTCQGLMYIMSDVQCHIENSSWNYVEVYSIL